MAQIYIVLCGEYSDRHIVAAFSTEAYAIAIADAIQGHVESYTLDIPCTISSLPRYCIHLARETGKVLYCREKTTLDEETLAPYRSPAYSLEFWVARGAHPYIIIIHCYARDPAHACRIAQELRGEIAAQDYWRFLPKSNAFVNIIDDTEIARACSQEAIRLLGK